jgi:hypothetical protein
LVVIAIEPVEATAVVGANVTEARTLPPGAMVPPFAGRLAALNGAAGPVTVFTVKGAFPTFEIVTDTGDDVEPTVTFPNGTDVGDTDNAGAVVVAPDVMTTFLTEWTSVPPPVEPPNPTRTLGPNVTA